MFASLRNQNANPNSNNENFSFWELFWVPETYIHISDDEKYRKYHLSFLQRIFLTLEFPISSLFAEIVSIFNTCVILLSVISVIVSTLPAVMYIPSSCDHPVCSNDTNCLSETICQPEPLPVFTRINNACVVVFFIDFVARSLLCGIMPTRLSGTVGDDWDELERHRASKKKEVPKDDPSYDMFTQYLLYMLSFHTLIDCLSIIPSFIAFVKPSSNVRNQEALLRIFRLLRVFRMLHVNNRGRMIVKLLRKTMHQSREAIAILLFYLAIAVIFFADIVFTAERGEYMFDSSTGQYDYLRPDGYGGKQRSPFSSIPTAIYYAVITLTTIGYGDITPTTNLGRAFATTCALLSVLVLALPITVIGNNFSKEYDMYLQRVAFHDKKMKQKKKAIKKKLMTGTKTSLNHMNASFGTNIRNSIQNKASSLIEMIGIRSPKANSTKPSLDQEDIEAERLPTNDRLSLQMPSNSALDMPTIYADESMPMTPDSPRRTSKNEQDEKSDKDEDYHSPRRRYQVARFFSNSTAWTARQNTVRFRPISTSHNGELRHQRSILGSKQAYEIGTLSDIDEDGDGEELEAIAESPVASSPESTKSPRFTSKRVKGSGLAWLLALSEESIAAMPREKIIECFFELRREHESYKMLMKRAMEDVLMKCD